MAEVIVRPTAQADIRESALWYEGQRPGLGIEFTLAVDFVAQRIAHNAYQFPTIEGEVRRALLRRFPYGVYFIIDVVPTVIAVLHQRATRTRGGQGRD